MATLNDFRPEFDNAYQEVFQKTLVAKEIMNTRFEAKLRFGESVKRVSFDISGVLVRTVTRNNDSTIDNVTDTSEVLNINLEKEAVFRITDGEMTQAGPLNPGQEIGKQVGIKVALDLDGRCFYEVRSALFNFDAGDLTTGSSTGTPITLSSTTVPQMTSRMAAKLRFRNNQEIMSNMVLVVDAYAAADITQYLLGKNIDLAGSVFKNGYTGDVNNAMLYTSENLSGEATLVSTGVFTDAETVTINGVVFTAKTALGAVAGQFLIGANAAASITNLTALINAPTVTTAQGIAITAVADLDTLSRVAAVATSATVLTINGIGGGRFVLAKTSANWSWATSMIHAYFGKKGAIDLVVQDLSPVEMRPESKQRATIVFASYLAGIKTFADGAKKFLNVLIDAR